MTDDPLPLGEGFAPTGIAQPPSDDVRLDADVDPTTRPDDPRPPVGDTRQEALLRATVRSKLFASAGAEEAPKIGRYAILKVLGEGGMGTVYACFDDQLDRRVALKLVKTAESPDSRRRMLREAQAMAQLSHPNVVPVFEVGEHEGQLFVAMEYVRGVTLKEWRSEEQRHWREVLGKYLQAGRGLVAAHLQGLVHRDFKPDNAVVGTDGRVRVLDFGLAAKRGEQENTDSRVTVMPVAKDAALDTPLTETGTIMGTPAYMSPEQFMGDSVDARSDQFSFCVALWEGLYGARPFSGTTTVELFMRVAKEMLTKPVHTDVPVAVQAALERGLRVTPEDRWPDLASLLAELGRLNIDPRRARRTKRLAGATVLGGLVLAGGVWLAQDRIDAHRTNECRSEAAEELAQIWNDDVRARAREGMLATGMSNAQVAVDKTVPWLDDYATAWGRARSEACLETRVVGERTEADLDRSVWCLEQRAMGLQALATELQEADRAVVNKAVVAAATLAPVDPCSDATFLERLPDPPTDVAREAIAEVRRQLSKAAALAAIARYKDGLEVAQAALEEAMSLGDTSLLAAARHSAGVLRWRTGQYSDSADTLRDAYFEAMAAHDYEVARSAAVARAFVVGVVLKERDDGLQWARLAELALGELGLPPDHLDVAAGLILLANVHGSAGEWAEAKAKHERALAIQENALGPDHIRVATTLTSLATAHYVTGDYVEAVAKYDRALIVKKNALGPDHPDVATGLIGLANVHIALGEYAEAKAKYERALAIQESALGPDHPTVAKTLAAFANVDYGTGETAAAKVKLERALAIQENALGPDHADVAGTLVSLATLHDAAGEHAEAKATYARALAVVEKALGAEHPRIADALTGLATAHYSTRDYAVAKSHYERALAITEKTLGAEHPKVATILTNLANVHDAVQEYTEAKAKYERALGILQKVLGADHPHVAIILTNLANVHTAAGEHAEATTKHERALAIFDAQVGTQDGELEARVYASKAFLKTGDPARAVAEAKKAAEGYRTGGEGKTQQLAAVEAWLDENAP